MHQDSERDLIEGLISGDMASYKKLFESKYTTFYTFIKGMVKQVCVAEDITQNIFMKVWINRTKLNRSQSIHNYLYVLAKNEVRDYFRLKSNSAHDEVNENLQPFVEDLEGLIDVKLIKEQVAFAVSQMPDKRQQIYILSREKMLSNKEISELLNLSVRTVERHIFLALKDIRNYISELSFLFTMLFIN